MNSTTGVPTAPWAAIPKSRFCVWLFLSTEVMFFSGLIGAYLVMRYGIPQADWPNASSVGLVPWIGAVNTLILLASSFFMTKATGACSQQRPRSAKSFLIVALLLGVGFLAVKSYEYWEKFRLGLYPRRAATLIYPRCDTEYLAAVQRELALTRGELESTRRKSPSTKLDERIALLDELKLGLVGWTGREVGQSNDPAQRDMAVRALAHAIRPMPQNEKGCTEYLREQRVSLEARRDELEAAKQQFEQDMAAAIAKLQALASDESNAADRAECEKLLADRRLELTNVNNENSAVVDRLKLLVRLADVKNGINAQYELRLPIVLPGGRTWLNGYYLLTGMHALHLLAGIIAAAVLLPMTLNARRALLLGNVATYWHFVDCVWLVLFPIIYLL